MAPAWCNHWMIARRFNPGMVWHVTESETLGWYISTLRALRPSHDKSAARRRCAPSLSLASRAGKVSSCSWCNAIHLAMSQSSSSWLGHTDFSNSIVRDDTSDGASGEHPRAPGPAGAGLAAADIAGQTAAGAEMTAVWPEERPSPGQVGGQDPRTLSLHSAMDAWARINPFWWS